ncbi:hypothetical protein BDQ17DRAFT_1426840 [Cyathus striatus]|nr:hypothetical protein BDQ17DRAFT_1426840 [Cyathus striatus]
MLLCSFECNKLMHPPPSHTFQQLHADCDEDLVFISEESFKYFPNLTMLAIRVGYCYEKFQRTVKIVVYNDPLLQTLTIFLGGRRYRAILEGDEEIDKWLELDEKVEVINSREGFAMLWKERVTTRANDFTFDHFPRHCSDKEELTDWNIERYYDESDDDSTDSELDEDVYDVIGDWPEVEEDDY